MTELTCPIGERVCPLGHVGMINKGRGRPACIRCLIAGGPVRRDNSPHAGTFSTTAGVGHFGPLVPVARAGVAAGWEVAVAAPAEFRDTVRATGLMHLPFASPGRAEMRAVVAGLEAASRPLTDRVVPSEVFGRLDAQAALPGLTDRRRLDPGPAGS